MMTLPHEVQWEKAARGTDARCFPFGNTDDATFMNTSLSFEGCEKIVSVKAFPVDESPYGARGLGGNSRDVSMNEAGKDYPGVRVARGGDWTSSGFMSRSSGRTGSTSEGISINCGGRMAWFPRCCEGPDRKGS